ncbi:MAG: hypothetical protein V1703_01540 [Candidatus Altiarchaeota archaeon]
MDLKGLKWFRVAILSVTIACIFLLLFSVNASAAWWNPISWIVGLLEIAAAAIKTIINLIGMLIEISATGLVNWIAGVVKSIVEAFFDVMKYMLTLNPVVYSTDPNEVNQVIRDVVPTVQVVLQPLYVMMVIFTGIYYIFAAIDPKRRSLAKNMLMKMFVGMVMVGLSMPIYQFTLNLSAALTNVIFSEAYNEFASQSGTSIAVFAAVIVGAIIVYPLILIIILFVVLFIILVVLLVMALRHVAVLLLAIMFPIAMFLYFFDATKKLGANLIYQAIAWIFIPPVQALMIVITFFALEGMVTGWVSTSTTPAAAVTDPNGMQRILYEVVGLNPMIILLMFFMIVGGLLGIIVAPLIMLEWMKWVGGAIAGYGMLKIPAAQTKEELWKAAGVTTLGGTMMGGLSKGIPMGASQAAYMSQYFNPSFGDAARLDDVMPTWGEFKSWFGDGSSAYRSRGSSGAGAPAWAGAAARARKDAIKRGEGRGLVRDFFGTYLDAFYYDKRQTADLMRKFGPGGPEEEKPEKESKTMPLSPATTLSGAGIGQEGQYGTRQDDSYGARGVYLGKVEGPPFLSIPLYFFGGVWGASLRKKGGAMDMFKKGEVMKGVGMSLFETFKMFSPFRPIRHLGRILYTAIPEFVPPIPFPVPFIGWNLRDVAWWGSRKMMGLGFGQIASRLSWSAKISSYQADYNAAGREVEKARSRGDRTAEDAARARQIEAGRRIGRLLEDIRTGTGIRRMSDVGFYNKTIRRIFESNRQLHYDITTSPHTQMEEGRRSRIRESLERVRKTVDSAGAGNRKSKALETDADKLLYDYIDRRCHGATFAQKLADFESRKHDEILKFREYIAAMQFGVGVKGEGKFDLNKMKEYIDFHKRKVGNLTVEESNELRRLEQDLDAERAKGLLASPTEIARLQHEITLIEGQKGKVGALVVEESGELARLEKERDSNNEKLAVERAKGAAADPTEIARLDSEMARLEKAIELVEGDVRRSERLLEKDSLGAAAKSEMTRVYGREAANIWITDATDKNNELRRLEEALDAERAKATPDPNVIRRLEHEIELVSKRGDTICVVDASTSQYIEKLKNWETGSGRQPIYGMKQDPATGEWNYVGDERTEQGLDGGLWGTDPGTGRRKTEDTGVGSQEGFAVRIDQHNERTVHYRGHSVHDIVIRRDLSRSRPEDAEDIERIEYTIDAHGRRVRTGKVVFTIEQEIDIQNLNRVAGNAGKRFEQLERNDIMISTREEADEALARVAPTHPLTTAEQAELDNARREGDKAYADKAVELVRKHAVLEYRDELTTYITDRGYAAMGYTDARGNPITDLNTYMSALQDANSHIHFSDMEVMALRKKGYDDREIDHLKIVLHQEYVLRGGTSDIRLADDSNSSELSWVTTDEAGRRTMTVNVGANTFDPETEHATYTPTTESVWMQELREGDALHHERAHDDTRGQVGADTARETLHDFCDADTSLKWVYRPTSVDDVKAGIMAAWGYGGAPMDEETTRAVLREKGLNEEDFMRMVYESMSIKAGMQLSSNPGTCATSMGRAIDHDAETLSRKVALELSAGAKPGGWDSDVSRRDVIRLARWKAAIEYGAATGITIDPAVGARVDAAIGQLHTAGYLRMVGDQDTLYRDNFNELVAVQKSIMENAERP